MDSHFGKHKTMFALCPLENSSSRRAEAGRQAGWALEAGAQGCSALCNPPENHVALTRSAGF